jgi:hypothetical protein
MTFRLQFLHRQYLNADVNLVANEESHVLDEEIVCDEGVLAELHPKSDALFHEIGLVVRRNWLEASFHNFLSLLLGWKLDYAIDHRTVSGDPVGYARLVPVARSEFCVKQCAKSDGAV